METIIKVEKRDRSWASCRTQREFSAKPRAYIFQEGESILENLANRRNRPVKLYRAYLEHALMVVGQPDATAYWNQKAGCNCGCSPGFIINNASGKFDLFITVKYVRDEVKEEEQVADAA